MKKSKIINKNQILEIKSNLYSFSNFKLQDTEKYLEAWMPFFLDEIECKKSYIDLRYYRGTDHSRYIGYSFNNLINGKMERIKNNFEELSCSYEYYFSKRKKDFTF